MQIKHHIATVILACALSGLGLVVGISRGVHSLEHDAIELGRDSVAHRSIHRLETVIDQWLLLCDLLLSTDATYLREGAQLQANEAIALLATVSTFRLASDSTHAIEALTQSVELIDAWVGDAASLVGPDRRRQINDLVILVDEESAELVSQLATLSSDMSTRATGFIEKLKDRRRFVNQASWAGSLAYLILLFLIWGWTYSTVVRPLQQLSIAAREHGRHVREHQLWPSGPSEIRELAVAISNFGPQLWSERSTTEEVNQQLRDETAERSQLERQLRTAHAHLQELYGTIPNPLVVLGQNCVVTEVNDTTLALLGYKREELIGKPATVFWENAKSILTLTDTPASRPTHVADETWLSASGTAIPVNVSATTLETDDSQRTFVCIGLDIREHKRLATEMPRGYAQNMEAVGQLTAGIAHEINTPIQFVTDNLHFLRDSLEGLQRLIERYGTLKTSRLVDPDTLNAIADAERDADLDYVKSNIPEAMDASFEGIRRVTTIVSAMKTFAHPLSGKAAPFDLNETVTVALTMASHEYKYVADVETDLHDLPLVMGHRSDVNQVLLNLVVNAAHAIAERVGDTSERGRLSIGSRLDGDYAELRISDTGVGIPDNIKHRVFEPFFTTKELGKGTGHGLPLVHAIVVDKHSGSLSFETEVGIGTTFVVRLPINGPGQTRDT